MDIRKLILFFCLLICHSTLATESVNASRESSTQINGATNVCKVYSWIPDKETLGTKWKDNDNKPPHEQCPHLIVWVNKAIFTEFVEHNKDNEVKGGFSIAIFCLVLQELPFKIQPVFQKPVKESYNEIVKKLKDKPCEAVGGDISITANRTDYVDFTIPYMSSEIYMLVPAVRKLDQTMKTLVKPFTTRLWVSIICACIFIGVAIGILEYRQKNPIFYGAPLYKKLLMIIWFPVSKFFLQEGRIYNKYSKVVLVIWLATIFIIMQIFTACLSSWLTLNQLHPKVPKQYQVVGYQNNSFVKDFVYDHVKKSWSKDIRLPLSSVDEYKHVLDNGTVDAIFDERPYIDLFLQNYEDSYTKVGPLAVESGFGFALSRESHELQQEFSKAVVKVTDSQDMTDMKNKYLGNQTPPPTQRVDTSLERLDVHSFILLFTFMGLATIIAFICSEISLMVTPTQISPGHQEI